MATGIVARVSEDATDFVPEVFGMLTTLGPGFSVHFGSQKRICHMVRCECGTVKRTQRRSLVSGNTQSCGCQVGVKHGFCGTPEYSAYNNMIQRCTNPKHKDYPNYGGRGIKVFPEWLGPGGFERWLAYIGLRPGPGMTQERKDGEKGYEPGNVCWATYEEQANNTRRNLFLTHDNQTKSLAQWAKTTGINRTTLKSRLLAGWTVAEALSLSPSPLAKNARDPKI